MDFSYLDPKLGILGESWHTDILLEGNLNDESMVCDFSIVKKLIKRWLDDNIDHKFAIPTNHPLVTRHSYDERTHVQYKGAIGNVIDCIAPHQAFAFIPTNSIDEVNVAKWVEAQIQDLLPAELAKISISFYPEKIEGVQYQYSHGLKKHDGNCQRIVHGHRSTIEIYQDNARSPSLEKDWSIRWKNIYLGTKEDLVDVEQIDGHEFLQFSYVSSQGKFDLSINKNHVYMLDCDTTVESLAEHIATVLSQENPNSIIEVHAFEGVGKGAICKKTYEASR